MFDEIERALRGYLRELSDWRQATSELRRTLWRLSQQGVAHAKPWFKGGKYMYLVHRTHNGVRVREYIGSDPHSVEEALARIERARQYAAAKRELENIEEQARALAHALRTLCRRTEG